MIWQALDRTTLQTINLDTGAVIETTNYHFTGESHFSFESDGARFNCDSVNNGVAYGGESTTLEMDTDGTRQPVEPGTPFFVGRVYGCTSNNGTQIENFEEFVYFRQDGLLWRHPSETYYDNVGAWEQIGTWSYDGVDVDIAGDGLPPLDIGIYGMSSQSNGAWVVCVATIEIGQPIELP